VDILTSLHSVVGEQNVDVSIILNYHV